MKLKNKKTGEIGNLNAAWLPDTLTVETTEADMPNKIVHYNSLAELNEEWEDYEENEYYYAITSIKADGGITKMNNKHNDMTAFDKSIGNYFETREEAEKAVEKLKAWKRLKDKGFGFTDWYQPDGEAAIVAQTNINLHDVDSIVSNKDLDLLFGGGE